MNGALLLDTNVWLDYYLPGRRFSDDAITLVIESGKQMIPLLVTPGTMKDFFYLAVREMKRKFDGASDASAREFAWAMLDNMRELATVVGADASDVWIARESRPVHDDFEDNLIIAAAMRANARYLITNDADLLRHAPVACLSSADWCALHAEREH